jgi:pterin-4a-carbinolamine dehydratase
MATSSPSVFINYRRSDSSQAVLALYFQLRLRFGSSRIYMDVNGVNPGEEWPERIRRALDKATIVLAVIGPQWLTTSDEYGRRRIDAEEDWVRLELKIAVEKQKLIIPLLVGGVEKMLPKDALPSSISKIAERQAFELRDHQWDTDIGSLAQLFIDQYGFVEVDSKVVLPDPVVKDKPLTTAELDEELLLLQGWEPVESMIPRDYPRSRTELRRVFRFSEFKEAIELIQELIEPMERLVHHPRIENQWRTVIVCFTTWDIGHKVTQLDITAAKEVDLVYARFKSKAKNDLL